MPTDVPARVREHIARLPVPPGDLAAVVAEANRRAGPRRAGPARAGWWHRRVAPVLAATAPALAAAAALVVVLAVGVVPGLLTDRGVPGDPTGSGVRAASLPGRIARYSYLTGSVTDSPPGRAIMLYQQGAGVELGDFPQALVLGADRNSYRRVDVAERRSAGEDQGDPAPMLLSPDGTRVAVGSNGRDGDLAVVDLGTGAVRRYPAAAGRNVDPLAWSPDGRSVVALEDAGTVGHSLGRYPPAPLVRFDLGTGRLTRYPNLSTVSAAAYSPDGRELAVQQGSSLLVVDPVTGDRRREVARGGLPLRSSAAWSPDGRLLAVGPTPAEPGPPSGDAGTAADRTRIGFVDASGASDQTPGGPSPGGQSPGGQSPGGQVPAALTGVSDPLLGWAGPRTVLIRHTGTGHDNANEIVRIDLDHPDGGGRRRLAAIDPGPADNFMVTEVQLATGLLPGLRSRGPGSPDRGQWPTWWLVTLSLLIGVPAALIARRIVRRRRRRGLGPGDPPDGPGGGSAGPTDAERYGRGGTAPGASVFYPLTGSGPAAY